MQPPISNPNSKLKGRYLIERELGRGGIGVVYLARDERLHGMPVVIKFLLDASGQHAWLTSKFLQEAEALTRINHPGVVRVIDRDEAEDGRPFFVMEFIDGRSLRAVMSNQGMDLGYTAGLVKQIGHALHAAHQQGVFHRDLKPENVMLQRLEGGEEQVKLIDFGIAKVTNPQAGNETEISIVAGSQQYIAPEQLMSQLVSPATDVYAFAIIAYEMVTGRRPFNPQGATPFLVMQQLMQLQQAESFVKPQTFRPDLPAAAQILLMNALSFDPRRRPQDARIFADDLARALAGQVQVAEDRSTVAIPSPVNPTDNLRTQALATHQTSTRNAPQNVPVGSVEAVKPAASTPGKSKLPLMIGLSLLALVIVAGGIALSFRSGSTPKSTAPAPERRLNYSITMQKDPKRYPGSAPFQLPGEVIFSPGDRVRLTVSSTQAGHLYIINESPAAAGQSPNFNILFPSPTSNQGAARLIPGQTIRIPERGDGFIFDEEQGTEKLWLIWTAEPVPELEALKRWANPDDAGAIKDAAQVSALRNFLTQHSATKPEVEKDETNKQTILKAKGELLVKVVNLEHH